MGALEIVKGELVAQSKLIRSICEGDKERADRVMALIAHIAANPALKNLDPQSIVNCGVSAAALNLSPDPAIGHIYIVPYGGQATFSLGYKGLIQLLARAGWLVKIRHIFTGDEFAIEYSEDGWEERITYAPDLESRAQWEADPKWGEKNLRAIAVLCKNSNGDRINEVVFRAQIDAARKQAKTDSVWSKFFVEMATKYAIRKAAKLLPFGDSLTRTAIAIDEQSEIGKRIDAVKSIETGAVIEAETTVSANPAAEMIKATQKQDAPKEPLVSREEVEELTAPIEDDAPELAENEVIDQATGEVITLPEPSEYQKLCGALVGKLCGKGFGRATAAKIAERYSAEQIAAILDEPASIDEIASENRG